MLLTIEKLVYGGDGLARGPDKTVFVPFVLEGEQVEAQFVEERPGFARAQLAQIVSSSPKRIEPKCPYFGRCGGCHYQHTGYEHQLEIKSAILRETLRRIGKLDWSGEITIHPSPPWNYRNRTRMRVMREPEFSLAYFRFGSHQPLAIAECPISSPLINRAIAAINGLGEAPPELTEIEFFANEDDTRLMLQLYLTEFRGGTKFDDFGRGVASALHDVSIVFAFSSRVPGSTPEQVPDETQPPAKRYPFFGAPVLAYRTSTSQYRVSAGSFFQTNRHMTETLVSLATGNRSGRMALDLYAGVGLFTVPLARNFHRLVAVESGPTSFKDLRHNAPANTKTVEDRVEHFLASREAERLRPDFVIVDPPRAGLGERVARQLAALAAPRITYVSCDPATLARDLRVLRDANYIVQQIHLVDLFPQTFHMETVIHLFRSNELKFGRQKSI